MPKRERRPLTIGEYEPGSDAYVAAPGAHVPHASRWWSYGDVIRTVQRKDCGSYIKSLSGWRGAEASEILDHVAEIRETVGVELPSGYADAFRSACKVPRESPGFSLAFMSAFRGGWQEALKPGSHPGIWRLYDLRQAYFWALLQGLPDPRFYHRTRCLGYRDTLYRVRLAQPEPTAPYPFNRETEVLATGEEIATYGLDVDEVMDGIAFRRSFNTTKMIDAITQWSFWKRVARAYWGAWASSSYIECHTPSKTWALPPLGAHLVWSHLIVSRVKMRVHEVSYRRAAHVFVDSVLIPGELPTGDDPGDWHLVKEYRSGVAVIGPGHFGPLGGYADKRAGIPLTDARRNTILGGH